MKVSMKSVLRAFAVPAVIACSAAFVAGPAAAQDEAPVPIDYFAVLDAMTNAELSPDGKYLAFRLVPAKNANAVIQILSTDDLSGKPFTAGAARMDIQSFDWLSDDTM
ncbi:MAG: hypothetical protein WA989_10290, partial [Henriciella sp.]